MKHERVQLVVSSVLLIALAAAARVLSGFLQFPPYRLVLVALCIWLAGEAPLVFLLFSRLFRLFPYEGGPDLDSGMRLETVSKVAMRGLIELALLSAIAIALFVLTSQRTAPQVANQATVRFDDKIEKDLGALLTSRNLYTGKPGPPSSAQVGPNETTVKLDPELERALVDYLKSPAASVPAASTPDWTWGFLLVLLIVAAAVGVGLWFAAKGHPEVTPLTIVSGLALAIIHEAPALPKPGRGLYWGLVYLVGIAGASAVISRVRWLNSKISARPPEVPKMLSDDSPEPPIEQHNKPRPRGEEHPLLTMVGFSLLLMAGTLAFVGSYREEEPVKPPESSSMHSYKVLPLEEVPRFDSPNREVTDSQAHNWLGQYPSLRQAPKGDILLLVGSADCTRMSSTNAKLAHDRADSLEKILHGPSIGLPADLPIEVFATRQHESCKATPDMRGVFPFLLQPTNRAN